MKHALLAAAAVAACGAVFAKLPPPDDAAKAKAAETKAKADWQAKAEAYQLCKVQDRLAAHFKKSGGAQAASANVKTAAAPTAPAAAPPGAAPASPPGGAAATGTPVPPTPISPCVDPGPFAYAPPEHKPLESSEAHSPAATAAGAPSVRPHSGEFPSQQQAGQQPAKK